ncbi:MAG: S-adenosyl-methyltransferase MraW [Parcubacteria group bacterium LiPW_15]|nr:MAG: S-adenosyl-methyltransferase MraW [Parcubacteria group bacterium LiPW_15]
MAHIPVLLEEVKNALSVVPGDFVVDGTVDGGGHAEALLPLVGAKGKILGLDLDEQILSETKKRLGGKNVILRHGNYADLREILSVQKLGKADALLLDLGFSSEQLVSGRGFSFAEEARDEPLLMTFDKDDVPVKEILRRTREDALADIIYKFGEERYSRRIARAIKSAGKIETAGRLAEVVRKSLPRGYEGRRMDPATRTFQALRIYANHELENLEKILGDLKDIVASGGRVAIISFHSLEDRIVKEKFRELSRGKFAELLNKKPIVASREETKINPRSRSAKLRAIKII